MQKICPFLWFDDNAEEAANLYISVFDDSKITSISRYMEGSPGPAGKVMSVTFELEGQQFMALNGGPLFDFNESISFFVSCQTQEEVDRLWERLSEGGEEQRCGWLKDRFGLSWQIVPSVLGGLMSDSDPDRGGRVMQAMLKMKKLDIKVLQDAHDGATTS